MRPVVLWFATALSCMDAALAGPGVEPLAEIPFTLHQNAVILGATIDGREEIRLLLDTGWGPLALVSTAAKRLGLEPHGPPGGLPRVSVGSLAIGGAVQRNASFEVFPAQELQPLIGPHDGVLGTAFFRDKVLQIDYPGGVVRFYARSPLAKETGKGGARATIPMVFSPAAGALPFTDAVLVGGKPVRALFDTGGSGAFVAMKRLVDRAGLEALPEGAGPKTAIGMLSNDRLTRTTVRFARVDRIALGPFVSESPRVMIAPAELEGDDWGHDLIIGYGFMRDYVVTFDYPQKLVTLEKAKHR